MNDGGPAFPAAGSVHELLGMSLRDYFAAAVMPQVVVSYCDCNEAYADKAAAVCYAFAEAMLKARTQ